MIEKQKSYGENCNKVKIKFKFNKIKLLIILIVILIICEVFLGVLWLLGK